MPSCESMQKVKPNERPEPNTFPLMPIPEESVPGVIIMSGVEAPRTERRKTHKPRKSRPSWELQRAFHPTQISLSLAVPFPLGPDLDPLAPEGPVPERLELLPNSYCLLLPGRFPFALAFACCS